MLLTLDNLNTQKIEIHTLSEDISVIKVLSLLPSAENSNLITGTLLVLNIFYPNDCLAPIQILRYRELNVVAPISLALHNILFSFSWLAILILIFTSTQSWDFQHKTISAVLYISAKSHHIFAPLK